MGKIKYLLIGAWFGLLLTKGQVVSWFKIRNMFFFREPDLYLIIGSAVITGIISVQILKRLRKNTLEGEPLVVPNKPYNKGNLIGGVIFGIGWFITGACPGPIFVQIGSGEMIAWVTMAGALIGSYLYALVRDKLPH